MHSPVNDLHLKPKKSKKGTVKCSAFLYAKITEMR